MFPHPDPVEQEAIEQTINRVVELDRHGRFRVPPLFFSDAHEAACTMLNAIRKVVSPNVDMSEKVRTFYQISDMTRGMFTPDKTYGEMSCRELLVEYCMGREQVADNIMRYPPLVFRLSFEDTVRLQALEQTGMGEEGEEEFERLRARIQWCSGLTRTDKTSTGKPLVDMSMYELKQEFLVTINK